MNLWCFKCSTLPQIINPGHIFQLISDQPRRTATKFTPTTVNSARHAPPAEKKKKNTREGKKKKPSSNDAPRCVFLFSNEQKIRGKPYYYTTLLRACGRERCARGEGNCCCGADGKKEHGERSSSRAHRGFSSRWCRRRERERESVSLPLARGVVARAPSRPSCSVVCVQRARAPNRFGGSVVVAQERDGAGVQCAPMR